MRFLVSFILVSFTLLCLYNCQNQSRGEVLYNTHCSSCHSQEGNGLGELIPSLTNSAIFKADRTAVICMVRNGAGEILEATATTAMPANESLSETEITNILNYVRKAWHSEEKEFSISEVKKSLESCNQ